MSAHLSSTSQSPIDALHQTVISVLEGYEQAAGLNYEDLALIAEEAIKRDLLGDVHWLEEQFGEFHRKKLIQKQQESFTHFPVSTPQPITTQKDLDEIVEKHAKWIEGILLGRETTHSGRANLQGANLSGMNLSKTNLSCANLSGVDFTESNLTDANLSGCNLEGSNFKRAWLTNAKLRRAKTHGASFIDADLNGVDWGGVVAEKPDKGREQA